MARAWFCERGREKAVLSGKNMVKLLDLKTLEIVASQTIPFEWYSVFYWWDVMSPFRCPSNIFRVSKATPAARNRNRNVCIRSWTLTGKSNFCLAHFQTELLIRNTGLDR